MRLAVSGFNPVENLADLCRRGATMPAKKESLRVWDAGVRRLARNVEA